MSGEYEVLTCPFCEKGQITYLHFPSVVSQKNYRTATFGSTKERTKSAEVWIVQSGCSSCGKNKEDVDKELRNKGLI